jgi:hypothetical protein
MYLDGTGECARIATPRMKLPQFMPTNAAVGLARRLQEGSVMENKIQVLRKCITRVARCNTYPVAPYVHRVALNRFVGLWQARNRRTRVMMTRQRSGVQA